MSISTWRKNTTIITGEAVSDSVDMEGMAVLGIMMPAAWDTANLTFRGSHDNESWQDIYDDDGIEVTVAAGAGRAISVDLAAGKIAPWRYVKIRSGTTGTPVTQSADRSISFVCKG